MSGDCKTPIDRRNPQKAQFTCKVNKMVTELAKQPVEKITNKGARTITAQIRKEIEIGVFTNGDQLPAERQLSERYHASRSTIRKALTNLEQVGLVVRKIGSGTFVNYRHGEVIEVDAIIDKISPLQLVDTRIGFERQMTRLAVINATARDLETIGAVLNKLESSANDKEEFTRWDLDFHLLLATASKNPLIVHFYNQINEVRNHSQWNASKDLVLTPEHINDYNRCHRAIYNALCQRDATGALEALNDHMELARTHLIGTEQEL